MFMVTIEDAIAIHRAHQQGGNDAALGEVRRRWIGLADHVHLSILGKVLRLKVELPKPPVNERAPPSPGVPEGDRKCFKMDDEGRARSREEQRRRRARLKSMAK